MEILENLAIMPELAELVCFLNRCSSLDIEIKIDLDIYFL